MNAILFNIQKGKYNFINYLFYHSSLRDVRYTMGKNILKLI